MGTSAKSEFLKEVVPRKFEPGPGNYNPTPPKRGPYFTLKGKFKRRDSTEVPGPGQYNVDTLFKKVKRSKHGLGLGNRYTYITSNGAPPVISSAYLDKQTTKTYKHGKRMYPVSSVGLL